MATRHQKAPTAAGGLGSLPRHLAGPHRVPAVINGRALMIGDLRASRNALTGAAHRLTGIPNRLGRRRARPSDRSNSKAESGNGRNGNEFGHGMKGVVGWLPNTCTITEQFWRSWCPSGQEKKQFWSKAGETVPADPKQVFEAAVQLQLSTRQHLETAANSANQRTDVVETSLRSQLRADSPKSQQAFSADLVIIT